MDEAPASGDTVPVVFTVRGIESTHGAGRLLALATVAIELSGVELVLQGVQVIRAADGRAEVRPPMWRHPGSGKWIPCLILPPELGSAVGVEVLAIMRRG